MRKSRLSGNPGLFTKSLQSCFHNKPLNLLQTAYIAALLLLAVVSVYVHYEIEKVISQNDSAARVINVAGRQRMLSQRAAVLLMRAVERGNQDALHELQKTVGLMEQSHNGLIHGSEPLGLPEDMPEPLYNIYFQSPYWLDKRVKDYIDDVRHLLNQIKYKSTFSQNDEEVYFSVLASAESGLLESLDLAVRAYEENADENIDQLHHIEAAALATILTVIFLEALFIFRPLIQRVRRYADELGDVAMKDPQTGIFNRWAFMKFYEYHVWQAKKHEEPFSILLCEIDQFDDIVQQSGLDGGDQALSYFVGKAKACLRKEDVIARMHGATFAVLLPDSTLFVAKTVARKLLRVIQEADVTRASEVAFVAEPMTLSIGVSAVMDDVAELNEKLEPLERVEMALKCARMAGKNRFEVDRFSSHLSLAD